MLSVQTLARRIRQRLHDTDEITYDDDEILDCINCGVRFIRRIIADVRPALLMSEYKGVLAEGANSIALTKPPIKIINVTIGNPEKALRETEMATAIYEEYPYNEPKEFYLTGTRTIHFCPVPKETINCTIRTVDYIEELTWESNSPLNTEFDDFLVEYATIRLGVGNEYDMTQESQMLANIVAQIQKIIMPPPAGVIVKGYWSS